MGKSQFSKGVEVEVCSDDQGLRGVWFVATILQALKKRKVYVEYHTLMTDEEGSKRLREFVDVVNIRPKPPRETDRSYNLSDEVDAYHNDGWWEGIVTKVRENSRYLVYFRTGKEELEFGQSDLRIHREWANGMWLPPMEEKAEEMAEAVDDKKEEGKENEEIEKNAAEKADGNIRHIAVEEKMEEELDKEGGDGVTIFENADHLQQQEKLSIEGQHDQIGVRSDQTELSLVSNTNEIVRTTGSPVHETTVSVDCSLFFDSATSRCQSSNLEYMSTSTLAADVANESDTLEEAIGQPNLERNDSEISSPCEKFKEVEMMEGSSVLVAQVEEVTPSIPAPEGGEASLQSKKEITQNMFDTILSPSEELNDHLAPKFAQGEIGNVRDSDVSGSPPEIVVTLPPVNNGLCNSSVTISSPSEELNDHLAPKFAQGEIGNVRDCDVPGSSPEIVVTLPLVNNGLCNSSVVISSPSEELNDHLAPKFGQGEIGNVRYCDVPGSPPRIAVTLSPVYNERLSNSPETQVQCLEQNHNAQPPPCSINIPDQQQCLEAGWLFPEPSADGKEHAEKPSLAEPKVNKEKRKMRSQQCLTPGEKRPSQLCPKLTEPFIPSDEQQQCRRTGKGWRCSAMAFPHKRYCEKHDMEQNIRNQKRRKRPIEPSRVTMEPFQPSDPHQCRRSGKGWRCRAMALSGKRYCDKHQLEQNIHNEKRRKGGKTVETCLLLDHQQQCGEMDVDGGGPNQSDAGESCQPEPLQVDETCVSRIERNQADTDLENDVECTVNMQYDAGRSDWGNIAVSSKLNDQAHTETIQGEAAGESNEEHVSQVDHSSDVDISNESEKKKKMTGAFFDEFWPVFIT